MAWNPTDADINHVKGRMNVLAIGGTWANPVEGCSVLKITGDLVTIAINGEDGPIDWDERLDNITNNPSHIDRVAYILLRELNYTDTTKDNLEFP